jgi:hypothetical protein
MGKAHLAVLVLLRVQAAAVVAAVQQEILGHSILLVILLPRCRVAQAVLTVAQAVKVLV